MQLETVLTILIGIAIMLAGYITYKKKTPLLLNFNSWFSLGGENELLARILGAILIIIGIIIALLPFILGAENMNPL